MELEDWFDTYQYEVAYDIGESAVKTLCVRELGMDLGPVVLRYGHHRGLPELRETIACHYPRFSAEDILVTTGASEANFILVASLVNPGDHVIVEHPNYPSNYHVPRSLGCEVSLFSLRFENRFKPVLEELEGLITSQTKLVSLTHPNNPTGSMVSEEELQKIVSLVESKGMYLLFDETYREMDFKMTLPPAATLSPRVISISSLSKSFGLPGLRTGWLATKNSTILNAALAVREQLSIANNTLSEQMALRVLSDKEKFLEKARERIETNRSIVSGWMERQECLEWINPEVGVVGLPRFRSPVDFDPEKLFRLLAEKYKTFVVPGRCFEMENTYFRIGFGADPQEIQTGLSNLEQAIKDFY